ncbi:hypothetical protein ASPWEDRAFT_56825 [Aspergillus wentii DTO 134E9]|uniref:Major facilitator superfamily (MFS) profile domain-containing protein n=1 Tax=Aspergillus wentii DTO 134E9 TaxID=1073089 RepID=A0A1L9S3V2_ASPWE|nr:uncharacterized protein ASPWEDRAFT_56825 [Aspergillus wentii DTO 134E9]OJJ41829.1 hypothetical protein ASPWEDRAFT_56825 [Aspergillus wentii DTO 134E9]
MTDRKGFTASNGSIESNARNLKQIHRQIDTRILLWYSFVYLIMRVDVTNISNAAIINIEEGNGIKKELGNLTSSQWAWALSIFYYPYLFFEPASTVLLKRWSPSVWMSRIMITWGIISMCQGATTNYAGILATRFFLGLAEAGFYPGVLFHLSFWYNPDELPLRLAFFYASGVFSGTISGLLAYAVSFMNQAGGLSGWRWVFILEGIPAVLCGVYTYFYLPNYPETSPLLSEPEKTLLLENLPDTAPNMSAKTFNWKEVKTLLSDPTFLSFSLLWITHGIGGWGISFVLPTVIYELGMTDTAVSQLMSMPPSSLAFIVLIILGYFIRKGWWDCWVVAVGLELISIISYIILITVDTPVVKYIFVMIANAAASCVYPVLWPERIRAAKGTTSAAIAIGTTNACAQLMGIVGPQVYQSKFGPSYRVSYGTSIGLLAGAILFIGASWGSFWLEVAKVHYSPS